VDKHTQKLSYRPEANTSMGKERFQAASIPKLPSLMLPFF
jgi:hypothetical protein